MQIVMKTTEKNDYGFRSELQFRNNYSFFDNDLRIKQLENRNFIVPWQMVETDKKEVLVE
jgi:hypothetical protein